MPYINQTNRYDLLKDPFEPSTCGELNYIISKIIHTYITNNELCYATLNEVIGVLECAKLELYRQIAAPYEDKKKKLNGSVSDLDMEN